MFSKTYTAKVSIFSVWLFHLSGLLGILFGDESWFIEQTPINLCVCFGLLLWNARMSARGLGYMGVIFLSGISIEWVGIHLGVPFGVYTYGASLGPKISGVPYVIGINWAMLVYITASVSNKLLAKHNAIISKSLLGATLMVALDLLIEPNAGRLSFWFWENGEIPPVNFVAWFVISFLLHLLFQKRIKEGMFPLSIHLLLAQAVFFGVLLAYG